MRKFNKRLLAVCCVATMTASLTGCDFKTDTPVIGKIVGLTDEQAMRLGENICTVDEARLVLMNTQNQYKKDFGGQVSWSQKIGNTTLRGYVLEKVKSDLSIIYAMRALAEEKGIELTEEEADAILTKAQEYMDSLNDSEIAYSGATKETVVSLYTNYYLADKVYAQYTDAVSDTVSDEDARVMSAYCIYISSDDTPIEEAKKKLSEVRKQVKNGYQDFLVQANKLSDMEVEIQIKKNEAEQDYQKAALALKDGEMTKVITADDGAYLLMCVNSYLKEESDQNKAQIIMDNKINTFNAVYDKYLEDNSEDINTEAWDKIEFSEDENVKSSNLFDIYHTIEK